MTDLATPPPDASDVDLGVPESGFLFGIMFCIVHHCTEYTVWSLEY